MNFIALESKFVDFELNMTLLQAEGVSRFATQRLNEMKMRLN
jgi:hypothetical protein